MRIVTLFVSLLFLLFNYFSFAQTYESKEDTLFLDEFYIEDIIVTANKTEEKAQKLPFSVSTFTGLQQENKNMETLTDMTSVSPGFHMPDYGTALTSPIYIRGIGSRINEPAVALYVDDIPYFDKGTFIFDLYDISRIEVLKGPQGTLYGKNSLGGLIKIHTGQPKSYNSTQFSLGYGTYDNRRIYLKQHIPVVDNKLSASIAGNYRYEDGYYKNDFNNERIGGKDNISGRMKVKYNLSENSSMQFIIDASDNKNNGYPYSRADDEGSSNTVNYNEASKYKRKLLTSGLIFNKEWNNVKLKSISAFQYIDDYQDIDQDFTPKDYLHVIQDRTNKYYTQEINLSYKGKSGIDIMGGMFAYHQDKNKNTEVHYGADAVSLFQLPAEMTKYKDYGFNTNGFAIFSQLGYDDFLVRGLNVTAGLRYAYEKTDMDYLYDLEISGNRAKQNELDESMGESLLLPKLSLRYQLYDNIYQYVTFTQGYKSGGFNSTIEREEDISFGPEYSTNYEIGLKGNFFKSKVKANVALYYIDWQDQQVYQPVPSGQGSMLKNAGESHSQGAEMEIKYLPVKNMVLFANAALTEAKYDKFIRDETENIDFSGNYIPYIPQMTFNIGSDWRLPMDFSSIKEFRFSIDYKGIGKHYWNDENTLHEDYYGLMNFNTTAVLKKFNVSVWGKNVFNTNYDVFLFEFAPLQNEYAQQGMPARFGITISTNF
ncbi:MAG: TonB-dependent receptor [Bacteroidales bacterium]